jgi:putative DNA primase/helicase
VSSLDEELADDLCSLATGAGLQKRKLNTDTDQVLIDACRPIVLNGIPDLASRGDFADRAIVLAGTEIPDDTRREEAELEQEFVAAAPAILGALLDGVAAGLKGRSAASAAIKQKPRMADFAIFAAAAASAFGWTAAEFLEAYAQNRQTRFERVVEADPVAEAIQRLVLEADPDKERAAARPVGKKWSDYREGTASELLQELEAAVSDGVRRQKRWPKGPAALSNRLTRAATGLRRLGIAVEKQKSGDRKIKLGKTAPTAPTAFKLL